MTLLSFCTGLVSGELIFYVRKFQYVLRFVNFRIEYYKIEGITTNKELKHELECLNDNLRSVVKNQAMIYCKLKEIEDKIKPRPKA